MRVTGWKWVDNSAPRPTCGWENEEVSPHSDAPISQRSLLQCVRQTQVSSAESVIIIAILGSSLQSSVGGW